MLKISVDIYFRDKYFINKATCGVIKMKKELLILMISLLLFTMVSCSHDLSNIIKKVDDINIKDYKIKGIITKIFFLDTDKIYLYEISSEKVENSFALLISNNKYRRGDKLDLVIEAFKLSSKTYEQTKEVYWSILKNYIQKKTLFSNTEIILLVKKIDTIVNQYLMKNESITIFLESHQNITTE